MSPSIPAGSTAPTPSTSHGHIVHPDAVKLVPEGVGAGNYPGRPPPPRLKSTGDPGATLLLSPWRRLPDWMPPEEKRPHSADASCEVTDASACSQRLWSPWQMQLASLCVVPPCGLQVGRRIPAAAPDDLSRNSTRNGMFADLATQFTRFELAVESLYRARSFFRVSCGNSAHRFSP